MISDIYNLLNNIIESVGYTRFHMPGHKGRTSEVIDWNKYDLTEIPGTDNLGNPTGILKDVQERISDIYGSVRSYMLVNGSTVGILTSLISICSPGDSFIIPRNSHKSIYSSLILHRIRPIYIYQNKGDGLTVDPLEVEKLFRNNPSCKGIIITSPTYYGTCSDIKTISKITKKYKKILIVDEAHGAHLKFSKKYPDSSVDMGADVVIQSTHKMLKSFNQGGLLHICSENIDVNKIKKYLNMLQTTSPSYPIMISVENAVMDASVNGEIKLNSILDYYDYAYSELHDRGYKFFNEETIDLYDYDRSKLWIRSNKLSGYGLYQALRTHYNIQVEMCDEDSILAMMGMGTEEEDIIKLVNALKDVKGIQKKSKSKVFNVYPVPKKVLELWETDLLNSIFKPLDSCIGKIASDFIIPYPPGIPLIVPGEKIDKDVVDIMKQLNTSDIIGLTEDGRISVIE